MTPFVAFLFLLLLNRLRFSYLLSVNVSQPFAFFLVSMAESKNYRTIISITVMVDTCTIHPEYHEDRIKKVKNLLDYPISKVNRMFNVMASCNRLDTFYTDIPDLFNDK